MRDYNFAEANILCLFHCFSEIHPQERMKIKQSRELFFFILEAKWRAILLQNSHLLMKNRVTQPKKKKINKIEACSANLNL